MNNQKTKRSNLTILGILTTLTLLIWAAFEVYQHLTKRDFSSVPENVLAPLAPELDKDTLEDIAQRKFFSQEEIASFRPYKKGVTSVGEESAPTASPSGQ